MLCGALLGKSPLVPALFANLAIDKLHELFSISPRPNNRNSPFIISPSINQTGGATTRFLSLGLSYLRHKWIGFISASGCLWPSRRAALKLTSDPLAHENLNETGCHGATLIKKAPQGLGPCGFWLLLVLSEAPRRLSRQRPRDRSYADRWCLRNKHARVRRV